MVRSIGAALATAVAPALLLIVAAHTGLLSSGSGIFVYVTLALAWLTGIVAIQLAGWPRKFAVGVMIAYTIIAIPALPYAGLLAVCTTGDCI